MKKILIYILVLIANQTFAQDLVLSIYPIKDPNYTLNESQKNNINSKLKTIVAEQAVASTNPKGAVGLLAELILNEPRTVNAGIKNLTAYDGELVVTAQEKEGKQVFGVYRKRVTGSGNTNSLAISNLVSNISTSDAKFTDFITSLKPKINEFYYKNCNVLLADSERMMNTGQLEEAINVLLSIPNTIPCRATADEKLQNAYLRFREFACKQSLTRAKASVAAKDYASAVNYLKFIDPESTCANDVNAFIAEMKVNANDDMKAQLDTVKEYFKALANQQNWQVLLMRDYMNQKF